MRRFFCLSWFRVSTNSIFCWFQRPQSQPPSSAGLEGPLTDVRLREPSRQKRLRLEEVSGLANRFPTRRTSCLTWTRCSSATSARLVLLWFSFLYFIGSCSQCRPTFPVYRAIFECLVAKSIVKNFYAFARKRKYFAFKSANKHEHIKLHKTCVESTSDV